MKNPFTVEAAELFGNERALSISDGLCDVEIERNDISQLAKEVIKLGSQKSYTVGTAESCTGGLVCGALTQIPGSSAVVKGGVVSYALSVKEQVLGVSPDILYTPTIGAVSSECAGQMALGATRVLDCDIAVSVTGIAGPGGAEPKKPVGTVWFGCAFNNSTKTLSGHFSGDRNEVRNKSVYSALFLLYTVLKDFV